VNLLLIIKERLLLPSLLPQQSDKMTMIISEDIRKKVAFTDKELKKYGIEATQNGWKWNDKFDNETVPFEFTEAETAVLKGQSKRFDQEKRITRDLLSLVRKIDEM
jgi:hypothetical protein